jgi:hypothetical protein
MAEQQVQIQKTIYSLNQFNNVVDTSFSQLLTTPLETQTTPDLDVNGFFNQYNLLFFDIPLSGSDNSHLGLASRSLEYLGLSLEDLQSEIDYLRQENVELKNQIIQTTGINPGTIEEI